MKIKKRGLLLLLLLLLYVIKELVLHNSLLIPNSVSH